jgi:hypothetical protein
MTGRDLTDTIPGNRGGVLGLAGRGFVDERLGNMMQLASASL